MTTSHLLEEVRVRSIFHPSDFSEASEVAFAHALKIALVARADLTVLHVAASPGTEWQDFPGVRDISSGGTYPQRKSEERGWTARHRSPQSHRAE